MDKLVLLIAILVLVICGGVLILLSVSGGPAVIGVAPWVGAVLLVLAAVFIVVMMRMR